MKTNAEHEAFKDEMIAEMKRACERHPSIRTMEIIAVFGRLAGYCVAMCYPDERDIARQTAIVNLDQAVSDVAMPGPSTAGHG
jgi:hypothetical protein